MTNNEGLCFWRWLQQYFQKEVPARFDPCPDVLFTAAYGVKYSAKRMKKWEKDYVTLKTKEQEDQEEVRVKENKYFLQTISQSSEECSSFIFCSILQRLRAENRLLRQKVSMLETESGELAERLVRGQVSRADQEETTFHLKRELDASRQRDAENTAQLRELQQRLKHMEEVTHSAQYSFIYLLFIPFLLSLRLASPVFIIVLFVFSFCCCAIDRAHRDSHLWRRNPLRLPRFRLSCSNKRRS